MGEPVRVGQVWELRNGGGSRKFVRIDAVDEADDGTCSYTVIRHAQPRLVGKVGRGGKRKFAQRYRLVSSAGERDG